MADRTAGRTSDILQDRLDTILGQRAAKPKRRRRRRKPRPPEPTPSQSSPNINITVNLSDVRKRPGSVRPGRPGDSDVVANDRSRKRRIAPSPG